MKAWRHHTVNSSVKNLAMKFDPDVIRSKQGKGTVYKFRDGSEIITIGAGRHQFVRLYINDRKM